MGQVGEGRSSFLIKFIAITANPICGPQQSRQTIKVAFGVNGTLAAEMAAAAGKSMGAGLELRPMVRKRNHGSSCKSLAYAGCATSSCSLHGTILDATRRRRDEGYSQNSLHW